MGLSQISELKLKEINLFLDLLKTNSVREVARQRGMQPGQVSKWIQSLETKLGYSLLERSNKGVQLTASASQLIPHLEEIQRIQDRLTGSLEREEDLPALTFASTSFFSTDLMPKLFAKLEKQRKFQLQLIDLPPAQFVTVALRGVFQVCVHSQDSDWPKTWTTVRAGSLRYHLCARKGHPLTKAAKLTAREVLKFPFVHPVYWTQEGLRYGADNCPIPMEKRIKGHATATAASAREIVRVTDQVAVLPELVVRSSVASGEIKVLNVQGWDVVEKPVYLTVKNELVMQSTLDLLVKLCEEELGG